MWTRLVGAGAALGVADDPAHGVAGGDRAGADELLAGFERDVGDLAGRGIDLIERAVGEGIDLDGVEIAGAGRLHAGRAIGLIDARVWIGRLRRRGLRARDRLELARQRQKLRQLDDLHRLGRIGLQHRLPRRVVVADRRAASRSSRRRRATAEASRRVASGRMRISRAPLTS